VTDLTEEARQLLHYPDDPEPTWTSVGRPDLEGEPVLTFPWGQVQVPPKPPTPGRRAATGGL
jgi:hypothetical protein